MTIKRIQDKYNSHKVWIIKRYNCGHYAVNQEICGKIFYKGFQRMTKRHINEVLEGGYYA
jgi:hypothetical protein